MYIVKFIERKKMYTLTKNVIYFFIASGICKQHFKIFHVNFLIKIDKFKINFCLIKV